MSNLFPPDEEFPIVIEITEWEEGKPLLDIDSLEVKVTVEDLKHAILHYGNACFIAGEYNATEKNLTIVRERFDKADQALKEVWKVMGLE